MKRYLAIIVLLVLVISNCAVKQEERPSEKISEVPIEKISEAPQVEYPNQIKLVADTTEDGSVKKEVAFMTSEGKVFKRLERGICPDQGAGTILSDNGQYALNSKIISYTRMGEGNQPLGDVTYKMIYYNAGGEALFEKVYKVYLEGYHDWDTKAVSENGERIMIYYVSKRSEEETLNTKVYGDKKYIHHVEILDSNGSIVCSKEVPALRKKELSRDGKLLGAETGKEVNGKWVKHLYFLNTDTGEDKICKAEGDNWEAWFSIRTRIHEGNELKNLPPLQINLKWKKDNKRKSKHISFRELSLDLYSNIVSKK